MALAIPGCAPESQSSPSWGDSALNTLKQVHGSDFEAITTGPITTS